MFGFAGRVFLLVDGLRLEWQVPSMKNSTRALVSLIAFMPILMVLGLVIGMGCGTDATTKAVQADAVVISAVNPAMALWAKYVNSGKATVSQVTTVSNVYFTYYQAQLVASNAATVYAENPSTTAGIAASNALVAASLAQTNIINIVNQLVK